MVAAKVLFILFYGDITLHKKEALELAHYSNIYFPMFALELVLCVTEPIKDL